MKYRYLLWDIDGTILNFLAAEKAAIRRGFERLNLGECTDEMIETYSNINVSWWKKLERNECSKPETLIGRFIEFFSRYNLDISKAEEFNRNYQVDLGDTIVFNPNAIEVLRTLSNLHNFGVTNGTKIAQTKKIKMGKLDTYLEEIFISEDVGFEKPNVQYFDEVFKVIESKYGVVDKKEVVIIGDSLTSDIQGGNNYGIDTIWYNPEHKVNTKENLKISYEIEDLSEILEIIK